MMHKRRILDHGIPSGPDSDVGDYLIHLLRTRPTGMHYVHRVVGRHVSQLGREVVGTALGASASTACSVMSL